MTFDLQSAANWAQLASLVVAAIALILQIQSTRSTAVGANVTSTNWAQRLPSYILFAALAFFAGTLIPHESRTVQVDLPNNLISNSGNSIIGVSSVKFIYPNEVIMEGTHKDLPSGKSIWAYLLATNDKYYIEKIRMFDNGTWRTADDVDIGSANRFGGAYEFGLLLADAQNCPELQDQDGLVALPSCATKLDWVTITRF